MKKLYFAKRDGLYWMFDETGPIAGPYPNEKRAAEAYKKRLSWLKAHVTKPVDERRA